MLKIIPLGGGLRNKSVAMPVGGRNKRFCV